MSRYAEGTEVSVAKSRMEVNAVLQRYGAQQRQVGEDDARRLVDVQFRLHERTIRLRVTWPGPDDPQFQRNRAGVWRTLAQRRAASEAEHRRIWRVLILRLKAELEATADDPAAFRRAFLADTLLPTGETVDEWAGPAIEESYRIGRMPLLEAPAPRQLPAPDLREP